MKKITLIDWVNLSREKYLGQSGPLEKMRYKIVNNLGWSSMGRTAVDSIMFVQNLAQELWPWIGQFGQLSGNPADGSPLGQQMKTETNWKPETTYWTQK
jgi:hypothetical protein